MLRRRVEEKRARQTERGSESRLNLSRAPTRVRCGETGTAAGLPWPPVHGLQVAAALPPGRVDLFFRREASCMHAASCLVVSCVHGTRR